MSEPTCPKCGAEGGTRMGIMRPLDSFRFTCGSYARDDGLFDQSDRCRIAELEQQLATLTADNERLRGELLPRVVRWATQDGIYLCILCGAKLNAMDSIRHAEGCPLRKE